MKTYKTMKQYINEIDFDKKLKYYRESAKHLHQFYEINIKNPKGDDFDGIYYFYTDKIIDLLVDYNNYKNYPYVNLLMVEGVTNSFYDKLFENMAVEELRYSAKIENEYINEKKVEKLDFQNLFNPISNLEDVKSIVKVLNEINGLKNEKIFRNDTIGIVGKNENKYIYEAIDYSKIQEELNKLIEFTKKENFKIIDAILVHILFELIHPLCDGNGRFGRYYLINLLIKKLNVDLWLVFDLSKNINNDKKAYYKYFELAEDTYTKGDVTLLIEYLLSKVVDSLKTNYNNIKTLEDEYKKYFEFSMKSNINTSNKKKLYQLIAFMNIYNFDCEKLTRIELQKSLGSNKKTIEQNLKFLIEKKYIAEQIDLNSNLTYYKLIKIP